MKNARPNAGAARDADESPILVSSRATFRIIKTTHVDFGAKQAELVVEVGGVGLLFVDIFEPQDRAPFAAPKSIRSKYTGSFERAFRLEDWLAAAILDAYLRQEELGDAALAANASHRPSLVGQPVAAPLTSAIARSKRTASRRRAASSDRAEAFLATQEAAFDRMATEVSDVAGESE